jgi:hypothetical protein
MAKSNPGHRVNVQLDSRIALEAHILNRLECLPATRRQEWLRGLLVQGFRVECQMLRSAVAEETHRPSWTLNHRRVSALVQPLGRREPATTAVRPSSNLNSGGKPFTALGKVIGCARSAVIETKEKEPEDPKP